MPTGRNFDWEVAAIQNSLDYSGSESRAVQGALVFRHRDELVHQRLFLNDVVRLVFIGMFKLVGFFAKLGLPQGRLDRQSEERLEVWFHDGRLAFWRIQD